MNYRWTLTYNSTSTVLATDPLGWDRAILSFNRDQNWHGVFSEYTVDSLEFICDGKSIILHAYEADGVNAQVGIRIDYRCEGTTTWQLLLVGSLDMGTLEFLDGANTAKVGVITESIARTLRSRYEMPVDLDSLTSKDGGEIVDYDNGKWPIRINSEVGLPIRKILAGKFGDGCIDEIESGTAIMPLLGSFFPPTWASMSTYSGCEVVSVGGEIFQANIAVPAGIEPTVTSGWETYWTQGCTQKAHSAAIAQSLGETDLLCCTALMPGRRMPTGVAACSDENNGMWVVPKMTEANNEFQDGILRDNTTGGYYNDRSDIPTCSSTTAGTTDQTEPRPIFRAPKDGTYKVKFDCEFIFDIATLALTVMSTCEDECTGGDNTNDWCTLNIAAYLEVAGVQTLLYSASEISPHGGNLPEDNYGRFTHNVPVSIDASYDLLEGQEFKIYLNLQLVSSYTLDALTEEYVQHAVWVKYTTTGDCCFAAYYDDYEPLPAGSNIPVYLPHEAANRIVASITDSVATIESALFGRPDAQPEPADGPYSAYGCASLQALTNGLRIRGFDYEGNPDPSPAVCGLVTPGGGGEQSIAIKAMTISLKQFFDGMDAINAIGMGVIEDQTGAVPPVVVFEEKEYFYQDTVALEINIVDRQPVQFERVVDTSVIYNELATGYKEFEGESYNGLFEFNTQRTYKTTILNLRRRLEKVCDFIASGYTFELTRRQNLAKNGSSDWRYDNSIFAVCMADTGDGSGNNALPELTVGGTPANILNPTATMNWRIAPWKMVRNWLSWIGRSGWPALNMAVSFTSGKANYVPEGDDPTNALLPDSCDIVRPIGRKADNSIQFTNEGRVPVYARPEKINLKQSLTLQEILQIRANPLGLIRLTEPTRITECWISKLEYTLEDNLATMELIPKIQ